MAKNIFCNIVRPEQTWKGVWQKIETVHISENQGFGTNRLAGAPQTISISFSDRHDWVLQRRGFLWFYTKIIFVLVSLLGVRPFCVKICQLGLIFQFSILHLLEGCLRTESVRVNFSRRNVKHNWNSLRRDTSLHGNFSFMKIELTQVDHNIAIYMRTN